MKYCRHHRPVSDCAACAIKHEQHVTIAIVILVALVGWAAFRASEPTPIDGLETQDYWSSK